MSHKIHFSQNVPIILFLTMVFVTNSAQAGSLLGLYTFENSVNDVSGSGNNPIYATGIDYVSYGSGFDLDGYSGFFYGAGISYMDIDLDLRTNVTPNMTWGAWVKAAPVGYYHAAILSNDDVSPQNHDRQIGIESGKFSAYTGAGTLNSGIFASPNNAWYFLAARYDSGADSVTLFVDDLVMSTTDYMSDNEPTTEGAGESFVRIGDSPHPNNVFGSYTGFEGWIDNVFIFDAALSDAQLTNIRLNGVSGIQSVATEISSSSAISLPAPWILLVPAFLWGIRRQSRH